MTVNVASRSIQPSLRYTTVEKIEQPGQEGLKSFYLVADFPLRLNGEPTVAKIAIKVLTLSLAERKESRALGHIRPDARDNDGLTLQGVTMTDLWKRREADSKAWSPAFIKQDFYGRPFSPAPSVRANGECTSGCVVGESAETSRLEQGHDLFDDKRDEIGRSVGQPSSPSLESFDLICDHDLSASACALL